MGCALTLAFALPLAVVLASSIAAVGTGSAAEVQIPLEHWNPPPGVMLWTTVVNFVLGEFRRVFRSPRVVIWDTYFFDSHVKWGRPLDRRHEGSADLQPRFDSLLLCGVWYFHHFVLFTHESGCVKWFDSARYVEGRHERLEQFIAYLEMLFPDSVFSVAGSLDHNCVSCCNATRQQAAGSNDCGKELLQNAANEICRCLGRDAPREIKRSDIVPNMDVLSFFPGVPILIAQPAAVQLRLVPRVELNVDEDGSQSVVEIEDSSSDSSSVVEVKR